MWLAAGGVAAGSWIASWGVSGAAPWALVPAAVALCFRRRRIAALAGLALVCLALGVLSSSVRNPDRAALAELAASVPRCGLIGRVLEEAGGLGTLVAVHSIHCRGWAPARDVGTVVVDRGVAEPGAVVAAEGYLLPLREEDGFDRARSIAGASAAFDASSDVETIEAPRGIYRLAAALRAGVRDAAAGLPSRHAALLSGLTIGETSGFDQGTIEVFRATGLSHLVAVSGSNVAIVLGSVLFVSSRASLRVRTALSLIALGLFVLVVGPDASVLRAAAMGAVAVVVVASGHRAEPLHALGLSLVALIGARPSIAASTGLHLSVAATLGIVLWAEPIARRLSILPRVVARAAGATAAAQLAVAPVLAIAFGQLSIAGLAANLLAIPAVPPATVAGFAGGLVGSVSPGLGELVARPAGPFVAWILWVADAFGSLPWAAVEVPAWTGWLIGIPIAAAAGRTALRVAASG